MENKQFVMVGGKTYRQEVDEKGAITLVEVPGLPTPPETKGQEK